jgi:hypothetical protein
MSSIPQKEDKIILTVFVLIILVFGGLFIVRDHIFDYISKGAYSEKNLKLGADIVDPEFNIEQENLLDISVFEKKKFQDLQEDHILLPDFQTGKNNPFDVVESDN